MRTKVAIQSQFRAALAMLKQAIEKCPDALWEDASYANPFWRVAYHALFYTHLYLQPTEADFVPWEKSRDEINFLSKPDEDGTAYSKADLLDYLALCLEQVKEQVDALDLEAESGFPWIPFDKLELQLYNIRHIMQHTGELCERLGAHGEVEVGWVGRG